MLTQGDFDERVFLHHNASEEIGTPTRQPMGTSTYQLMVTISTVFLVWYYQLMVTITMVLNVVPTSPW